MNRTRLNLIIDIVAFIGFVALTTTGVLMRYILPPGSGHYSTIWGLDRHEWGGIHFWISLGFFLILAFHLVTHWRWIVSVVKGKPREGSGMRAGLGIVGLITVIALAASPLVAPVAKDTERTGGSSLLSGHNYEDLAIRGSMTLAEVERASGVPAAHIVRALGLPESTSPDEQLGQLKTAYGFEIDDVREIVRRYRDAQ